MKFTVLGGRGFVGRGLCDHLRGRGHEVFVPARDAADTVGRDLGHVIYAIGLTSDFRDRPFDTVEAHVGRLGVLLQQSRFESWLYLSSTRVYGGLALESASEAAVPAVMPGADGVYDLSKLMGEALCLAQPAGQVRVARLSNVYGPGMARGTFLGSLLGDIADGRDVVIREAPASSKDYVALPDVCGLLERIALEGAHRLYNVASGEPLTHAALARALSAASARSITFAPQAPLRAFPRIDIARVCDEFGFVPARLTDELGKLLEKTREPRSH